MSIDSVWVVPDDETLASAAREIAKAQETANGSLSIASAIATLRSSSSAELRALGSALEDRKVRSSPGIMLNAFNRLVDRDSGSLSSGLILWSTIQPAIQPGDWREPANRDSSRELFTWQSKGAMTDAEFEVLIAVMHASEMTGEPATLLTGNEKLARLAVECGVGQDVDKHVRRVPAPAKPAPSHAMGRGAPDQSLTPTR